MPSYDALLVVSFGGPERPEDVIPFLENVLRGRNVPRARLEQVAEHYYHFGGKSPINEQCRALINALRSEVKLPIYWGNRNWHPFLEAAVRQMAADGVKRALAFVTSAYGSYSGCRQYLDDIERARMSVGPGAPVIEKLRHFHDHPGFIETMAGRVREALAAAPGAPVLFTAHSIPVELAQTSKYVEQLELTCRLTANAAGVESYRLVYQSRSGPPGQPWLEPDILTALADVKAGGAAEVVVVPIGFTSDHMEVKYDLDFEAAGKAESLGLRMVRAATAGVHPRFIRMIGELIEERTTGLAAADPCRQECCPAPFRPPASVGAPR